MSDCLDRNTDLTDGQTEGRVGRNVMEIKVTTIFGLRSSRVLRWEAALLILDVSKEPSTITVKRQEVCSTIKVRN